MSEHRPPRVRSASPRVRLFGDHSRRAKSPSVEPTLKAYRRDVEPTIRRDPISHSVPTVPPRGRSPERATTTETQRCSTDNDVYQEQYNILCERLRASESTLLDSTRLLREAEHRLKVTDYMIQHGAEGHTQSEDEASAREYPSSLFRNSTEAMKLREYLELEALNERLHLAVLHHDHRNHIRQSRDRADSLEIHCKLLQNSLTDAKSVETLHHKVALLRATADHTEFDFNLGDQHQEKTACNSYRRARDDSRRQWDAQLQALYKNHMEYYRRLSFRDVGVANNASGDTSREDRVGEQGEMPHLSHEGIGSPESVRGRQAVLSRAAYRPQSHQQSLEAQTAEVPSHSYQTNRERLHRQAIGDAVSAENRAIRNANNGSQVSMQGEHTHRNQKQTIAINNTNGRLGEPDGYTRHREAQPQTPISAPTQVSPPRNMRSGRNYEVDEYDSDSSQPMSPYDIASATIEQAQREREDSQHNGDTRSELEAEGFATDGSDSTMDSTVGMRGSVGSIAELDSAESNDSARNSTIEMRGDEGNNRSQSSNQIEDNNPAGPSHISHGSDWTLPSRPLHSYPTFPQHPSLNTTSASSSTRTPNPQPSAPGNLGVPRSPMHPSLSPLQDPPSSTDPSTFTSLSFSRAELELAIHSNVTRNMDLIPCAPASASAPIPFQVPCDPSLLHLPTPGVPQQPAPTPSITAQTYPDPNWNTANSRNWIYQNLVTQCGFPKFDAYNVVMGWMGCGMTLRRMSLFDWQALTSSSHAGWLIFRRLR
ncbi:hypothetical protein BPAE_0213g00060 [Botrytis paeoniae]|uniref:Uncharacterized protein n=1 Tax=Botrytis paeoniae TaxID=278948 RepID=A0A4Z1FFH0_9HELO|nr:hypothetical protein BPAE_0213g00060 [Botrytis paeoniae]